MFLCTTFIVSLYSACNHESNHERIFLSSTSVCISLSIQYVDAHCLARQNAAIYYIVTCQNDSPLPQFYSMRLMNFLHMIQISFFIMINITLIRSSMLYLHSCHIKKTYCISGNLTIFWGMRNNQENERLYMYYLEGSQYCKVDLSIKYLQRYAKYSCVKYITIMQNKIYIIIT